MKRKREDSPNAIKVTKDLERPPKNHPLDKVFDIRRQDPESEGNEPSGLLSCAQIIQQFDKMVIKLEPKGRNQNRHAEHLLSILDLLYHEFTKTETGIGFHCNRAEILNAYANGDVYMICFNKFENRFLNPCISYMQNLVEPKLHPGGTSLLDHFGTVLPGFCAFGRDPKKPTTIIIDYIWIHPIFRRLGLASLFVEKFKEIHGQCPRIPHVLSKSTAFWNYHDIEYGYVSTNDVDEC